jgi:hypothetical protein
MRSVPQSDVSESHFCVPAASPLANHWSKIERASPSAPVPQQADDQPAYQLGPINDVWFLRMPGRVTPRL